KVRTQIQKHFCGFCVLLCVFVVNQDPSPRIQLPCRTFLPRRAKAIRKKRARERRLSRARFDLNQQPMPIRSGARLEGYANADLYTPRAWAIGAVLGVSRRKLQEVDRRAARNRRAPVSVVEDVDRFDAKLRLEPLFHPELLEHREVKVPDPRPAELVAARIAEAIFPGAGWLREQALVVVGLRARSHVTGGLRITFDVDEGAAAARAVQIIVRAANAERRAGVFGKDAVELPAA